MYTRQKAKCFCIIAVGWYDNRTIIHDLHYTTIYRQQKNDDSAAIDMIMNL